MRGQRPKRNQADFEQEIEVFLSAMRGVAREEGGRAAAHLRRVHGDAAGHGDDDGEALACAEALEGDVARALRVAGELRWVEPSSSAPSLARTLLTERLPRPEALLQLCEALSLVRQVLDLDFEFVDRCLGDDLMFASSSGRYERAVAAMSPEAAAIAARVTTQRGLILTGGTPEQRARLAWDLHMRHLRLPRWIDPGRFPLFTTIGAVSFRGPRRSWGHAGCGDALTFIEDEALYAMSEAEQIELRRRLMIDPPDRLIFGAPSLDLFMEQAAARVRCGLLTYLFMDGQEHVDLDREDVHVSSALPAVRLPRPPVAKRP